MFFQCELQSNLKTGSFYLVHNIKLLSNYCAALHATEFLTFCSWATRQIQGEGSKNSKKCLLLLLFPWSIDFLMFFKIKQTYWATGCHRRIPVKCQLVCFVNELLPHGIFKRRNLHTLVSELVQLVRSSPYHFLIGFNRTYNFRYEILNSFCLLLLTSEMLWWV